MKPFGHLKFLKSAYGLTEVPRYWYLSVKNLLEGVGAVELRRARAVFVFRARGKEVTAGLIAILSLNVDDGLLLGDPRDPLTQRLKTNMDSTFNVKH